MKFSIFLVLVLLGCATPVSNLSKVSLGMTKAEVIAALGPPQSTAAQGGLEYLTYQFADKPFGGGYFDHPGTYFVRLIAGRVESYGHRGDFDSTKDPTQNLNIKVQHQDLPPPFTQ